MSPSILIAGATGNTGQALTHALPNLIGSSKTLAGHRIIALTRFLNSPVAQELAKVPGIEVIEKSWIEITADWLRENEVTRAFIASHNEPSQFADESTFHVNALNAGVKYVVRISTTAADVRPDTPVYYPRQHWAIEALLSTPEFSDLQWTSLQPNLFTGFAVSSAVEFIKKYRQTGKQDTLRLLLSESDPVALVDPGEVGILAAHLLAQDDISSHNKAKYVVNGPEDITGKQIVDLIEQHIGVPVQDVIYEDFSFVDAMYEHQFAATKQSKNVIFSIKRQPGTAWVGKSVSTTSKEIFNIAAPKITPSDTLKALLV